MLLPMRCVHYYLAEDLEGYFLRIWPYDQSELETVPQNFGPLPSPTDVILDVIIQFSSLS